MRKKIEFESNGNVLAGLMETPSRAPRAYVLFAHCFTCGKDIAAASRISNNLVALGFAVLRFDFTGLGNSDGDFSNTNFSSNLDDLLAASAYLSEHFEPPKLLVGHSLGGAAVLSIQDRLPSVKAIVTIGAPATAHRVKNNFVDSLEKIESEGTAKVKLGFREFTIKKQFLEDLDNYSDKHFALAGKALLIMHSPVDETVPIEQAERIYNWAKHPKSFVSLDDADHLLTRKSDSHYVAQAISGWVSRYIPDNLENGLDKKAATKTGTDQSTETVTVEEKDHKFTQTVLGYDHVWLADEPVSMGGQNLGPNPYEHLLAALGTCTSMTTRMYATHKNLPLKHVSVELSHHSHDDGTQELKRQLTVEGDLTDKERARILEIADKCPVHRTLTGKLKITTELKSN